MPAKNAVKIYAENGFYHIYNRGVEKRDIFLEEVDYKIFLSYLKTYLLPKNFESLNFILSSKYSSEFEKEKALKEIALKNFASEIDLLAYSLLSNHFHLLIRQQSVDGINRFMQAFTTRYTIYFNKKYHRVGPLLQGVYKAVLVRSEEQLLHLSRYIHLNPILQMNISVDDWQKVPLPFSLPEYLGLRQTEWVKPDAILGLFNKNSNGNNSYADFMGQEVDQELISSVVLDWEGETL